MSDSSEERFLVIHELLNADADDSYTFINTIDRLAFHTHQLHMVNGNDKSKKVYRIRPVIVPEIVKFYEKRVKTDQDMHNYTRSNNTIGQQISNMLRGGYTGGLLEMKTNTSQLYDEGKVTINHSINDILVNGTKGRKYSYNLSIGLIEYLLFEIGNKTKELLSMKYNVQSTAKNVTLFDFKNAEVYENEKKKVISWKEYKKSLDFNYFLLTNRSKKAGQELYTPSLKYNDRMEWVQRNSTVLEYHLNKKKAFRYTYLIDDQEQEIISYEYKNKDGEWKGIKMRKDNIGQVLSSSAKNEDCTAILNTAIKILPSLQKDLLDVQKKVYNLQLEEEIIDKTTYTDLISANTQNNSQVKTLKKFSSKNKGLKEFYKIKTLPKFK